MALCNPDIWDGSLCGGKILDYLTRNLSADPAVRTVQARQLCQGCPCWLACARGAIADQPFPAGSVVAGIAFPDDPATHRSEYLNGRRRLAKMIRTGRFEAGHQRKDCLVHRSHHEIHRAQDRIAMAAFRRDAQAAPGEWACLACNVRLRPRRMKLAEAPQTLAEHSRSLCAGCYRLAMETGHLDDYPRRPTSDRRRMGLLVV